MGKITVSKNNIGKPAPRGFRKVKNVLTIIFDASIMIAFFYGFTENSKEILVARIAYSAIMNSLEQLLANGEVYAPSETALGKK